MMDKKMFKVFLFALGPPGHDKKALSSNVRGQHDYPEHTLHDRLINYREELDIKTLGSLQQFELVVKVKALRYGPLLGKGDNWWGHCTFAFLRDAMVNALGFWNADELGSCSYDEVALI